MVPTRSRELVLLASLPALAFPRDAFADLHPRTGSGRHPGVVAALAAIGYGHRVYWGLTRSWLTRTSAARPDEEPHPPAGHR